MTEGLRPEYHDALGDVASMAELNEGPVPGDAVPIGERLRRAREAKGMTIDEVAAQTRIPTRHLLHIEDGNWQALPAITYSVGFARAYANAVGLDGARIGLELRDQLGAGPKPTVPPEYYEPADPARVPPRWLIVTAVLIAALLVGAYLIFRSNVGALPDEGVPVAEAPAPVDPAAQAPEPAAPAGPVLGQDRTVTLNATAPVWLRISDEGGRTLVERTLAAGETLQVPAEAQRPVLRVGAPEALQVRVGQTQIPQLGPGGRPVGNVSLLPEDLIARAQGAAPAQ
ncbi:MAG: helix-turn-helix domain-containing protein [Allosphingosinicella sp.]|uniref:helix-turn-helix domain-containing protein n=1 Tax=Allosphingosinicella sp. TaxID=2823234 RepID=UPI00394B7D0D